MKEKLIEYVRSVEWKDKSGNSPYENKQIENFINVFFDQYQPERSKREDIKPQGFKLNMWGSDAVL